MEKQIITKRISEIKNDISRLDNTMLSLYRRDIERFSDDYEFLSTDAALKSEKITCDLRHLVYLTTRFEKEKYYNSACIIHGVEIKYENRITEITLPCLLPKRKRQNNSSFLFEPFFYTLKSYVRKNPIPKYNYCTVCFSHVYNRKLSSRRVRDYDNIELKEILDIVSTFIMVDDSGLLCDMYNTTELGDKDCTRVFVMDKNKFPEWIAARKNSTDSNG